MVNRMNKWVIESEALPKSLELRSTSWAARPRDSGLLGRPSLQEKGAGVTVGLLPLTMYSAVFMR